MLRSMMQVYVKNSKEAAALYAKAFDAMMSNVYEDEDGSYIHAELDIYGQVIALSESDEMPIPGNTMQFCLHFGEGGGGCGAQGI